VSDDPRLRGLYPLADDDPRWRHDPRAVVAAALLGGATAVQLRLKHTRDVEALELARWAVARARDAGALLIVNDRFDLADLAGADGVHLGQDDLEPERIPAEVRARLHVGLSTHTLEQVRESLDRPVDAIAFGPLFGTRSKNSEFEARGLDALREVVRISPRPVIAIGGIQAGNLAEVARTGARAAALISAIADAEDPAAETRRLQTIFRTEIGGSAGVDAAPRSSEA
jgi:thiamine-phosphate pyrophosphorylase